MTDYTNLQSRCQRGESSLTGANNLLAECHAALGQLFGETERLKAEVARSTEREILQLAEIEALRKDAERYQWLRDKQTFIWLIQDWFPPCAEFTDVDAEIDAAMGKGEQS